MAQFLGGQVTGTVLASCMTSEDGSILLSHKSNLSESWNHEALGAMMRFETVSLLGFDSVPRNPNRPIARPE